MVHEHSNRHKFSVLTFRLCQHLALALPTAELARIIAGYGYPTTSLNRFSELELSAAAVYMASYVHGAPKTLTEVARLTWLGSETIQAVYVELYLAQERCRDAEWHDIFGGARHVSAIEMRQRLSFPPFPSSGRPA